MTTSTFAPALRKQIRDLLAAGGQIGRDRATVVVEGPPELADALRAEGDQLATLVPAVTSGDAALVRSLLDDAGVSIAYITDPAAARNAVADIRASQPEVIGLDVETEVLPLFRQPTPVAFNKDGNLAARQPAMAPRAPRSTRTALKFGWCRRGPAVRTVTSSICAALPGQTSRHCLICRWRFSTRCSR